MSQWSILMTMTRKANGCDGTPRYRYQHVLRWQTSVSCPAWKYTIVLSWRTRITFMGGTMVVSTNKTRRYCALPPYTWPYKPLLRHYRRLTPRGQNNTWYLIMRWSTETCQHIFCARAIEMWRALVGRLSRRAVNHPIHGSSTPRGTI